MITSKIHGYIDYVTAFFFLAAPSLFSLSETGTLLAYALAVVHLLMTLFTGFPLGLIKTIPFQLHGYVELVVSLFLIAAPWLLADFFSGTDRIFYNVLGAIILIVWFSSGYTSPVEA